MFYAGLYNKSLQQNIVSVVNGTVKKSRAGDSWDLAGLPPKPSLRHRSKTIDYQNHDLCKVFIIQPYIELRSNLQT